MFDWQYADLPAIEQVAWREPLICPESQVQDRPDCPPSPTTECSLRRWEAGFEFTFLKPRFEDGAEEEAQGSMMDFDIATSPRTYVTWVTPGGAGIRIRYWQFDQRSGLGGAANVPIDSPYKFMTMEAHTVDLELARGMDFQGWSLVVSAGARYAMLEQGVSAFDGPEYLFKRFHACGPTFAFEARQTSRLCGLSMFGNLRGSLLSGESRWANLTESHDADDIGTILEMQVGVEFEWQFACRVTVFVRSGWEQQAWLGAGTFFSSNETVPGTAFDIQPDDHDVAFMGFFVATGAEW